jgi:hypothetical protein
VSRKATAVFALLMPAHCVVTAQGHYIIFVLLCQITRIQTKYRSPSVLFGNFSVVHARVISRQLELCIMWTVDGQV